MRRIQPSMKESHAQGKNMSPKEIQDIFDAYENMLPRDKVQLRIILRKFIGGTPFTCPMDLMHQAMYRLLSGERKWVKGVPFVACLYTVARSIAHGARSESESHNESLEALQQFDPDLTSSAGGASGFFAESAEEVAMRNERFHLCQLAADSIRALMSDDPVGRLILAGVLSDMTPEEMREVYQLKESAIKAARQRVHKHLKAWREEHINAI